MENDEILKISSIEHFFVHLHLNMFICFNFAFLPKILALKLCLKIFHADFSLIAQLSVYSHDSANERESE